MRLQVVVSEIGDILIENPLKLVTLRSVKPHKVTWLPPRPLVGWDPCPGPVIGGGCPGDPMWRSVITWSWHLTTSTDPATPLVLLYYYIDVLRILYRHENVKEDQGLLTILLFLNVILIQIFDSCFHEGLSSEVMCIACTADDKLDWNIKFLHFCTLESRSSSSSCTVSHSLLLF